MDKATKFIPGWVKVAVALALGMGTMVGWKRIVVTVGEKIGKEHLTYAQGACAELVAMGTIFAADNFGLPVSTTHVLNSGVAGTMAANKSGLQLSTIRNIAAAWVFTLPVAALLSGCCSGRSGRLCTEFLAASETAVLRGVRQWPGAFFVCAKLLQPQRPRGNSAASDTIQDGARGENESESKAGSSDLCRRGAGYAGATGRIVYR